MKYRGARCRAQEQEGEPEHTEDDRERAKEIDPEATVHGER
jgi:hypothetical protein